MPTLDRILRVLRPISITEGVSFLVLLLVAMPLDRLADLHIAVQIVGWAHGGLFIALYALLALAWTQGLPLRTASLVALAAWVPTGPFFADRLLRDATNTHAPLSRASGEGAEPSEAEGAGRPA